MAHLGITDGYDMTGKQIDHIWPISLYDLRTEMYKAFNYRNTRICSTEDNQSKGAQRPDIDLAYSVPIELWPEQFTQTI